MSEQDLELPPLDVDIVKSLILTAVASMTEMTDERADYLDKHVDGWLAEVKAQAWDEGYVSSDDYYGEHDNPYRGENK